MTLKNWFKKQDVAPVPKKTNGKGEHPPVPTSDQVKEHEHAERLQSLVAQRVKCRQEIELMESRASIPMSIPLPRPNADRFDPSRLSMSPPAKYG